MLDAPEWDIHMYCADNAFEGEPRGGTILAWPRGGTILAACFEEVSLLAQFVSHSLQERPRNCHLLRKVTIWKGSVTIGFNVEIAIVSINTADGPSEFDEKVIQEHRAVELVFGVWGK